MRTMTTALIGAMLGLTFAAQAAEPLRVAIFSGSAEYKSTASLEKLKKALEDKLGAHCDLSVVEEKGTALNGVEHLATADVAVFFTRRVSLADDQLAKVKAFIASGKGVVGVRTASHGFQTWLELDKEVLGGSYDNHYKNEETAQVSIQEAGKDHPVLRGIKPFASIGKIYKNPKLADDVTLLLRSKSAEHDEPVAWVRNPVKGKFGRIFYTSLGTPTDFDEPQFMQMLVNAVQWTAGER